MSNEKHLIPRIAIQSIATGLLMMAFFTAIWAIIAHAGLDGRDDNIEIIMFGILAAAFVVKAIYFFSVAKRFPKNTSEADNKRGKKEGMWFGIIFGGEGLGIFIAINVVNNIGHPDLVIPAIALVVALHFYPLGWIFKRAIDYYLATWATIIAVSGIVFTLNHSLSQNNMLAFVGTGLAVATSSYGIYMVFTGRRMMDKLPVEVGQS